MKNIIKSFNIYLDLERSYMKIIIFALLALTVFCVMTSTSIQAEVKQTNDNSAGDNKAADTKKEDPVKPLTDGPKVNEKPSNNDKQPPVLDQNIIDMQKAKDKQQQKDDSPLDKLSKQVGGPTSDQVSKEKHPLDKLIDNLHKLTKNNNTTKPIPNPKPTPIPNKNCTSQLDTKTNNTLIICNNTVVKVIKGSSHTNTIVKTVPSTAVYNYVYPQTAQQLAYGNSLSANLAQYGSNSNSPATYLLLLDSKQLCLIAGDTQCVAQQDRFMTSSLTTIYDSTSKSWTITGTVKDVSPDDLSNIHVTALFYDGKGNTVGNNAITSIISPNKLQSFEDGVFSFTVSVKNDLNGKNPVFIVLNYSNDKNSIDKAGPTIGSKQTSKYGVPSY